MITRKARSPASFRVSNRDRRSTSSSGRLLRRSTKRGARTSLPCAAARSIWRRATPRWLGPHCRKKRRRSRPQPASAQKGCSRRVGGQASSVARMCAGTMRTLRLKCWPPSLDQPTETRQGSSSPAKLTRSLTTTLRRRLARRAFRQHSCTSRIVTGKNSHSHLPGVPLRITTGLSSCRRTLLTILISCSS